MVNEARAYRERVLSELARRRELAREQIEQLLHGRDRLMQSFERARLVAVDVVAELQPLGEPDEYVNLSPTTGPVPVMVPNTPRPAEQPVADQPVVEEPVAQDTAVEDSSVEDSEVDESTGASVVEEPVDEEPVDEPVAEGTAVDGVAVEDRADDEPAQEPAAEEPLAEERAEADESEDAVAAADDQPTDDVVVDLFARLRADTSLAAVEAEPEATDEGATDELATDELATDEAAAHHVDDTATDDATIGDDVVEATPFDQRDADLTPLIVAAAKKLKRVLADEQNEVLDRLRHRDPVRTLADLLPAPTEHVARYRAVIVDDLLAAAHAGASLVTPGRVARISRTDADSALAAGEAVLDEWLILPLRERLERCVNDGDGDNAAIAKRARSVYREWKTQHIDEQLDDVIRAAHGNGAFAAIEPGSAVEWVSDRSHAVCADCDDNTLGGAVAAGETFPTGHRFPPAHLGCRCLLLPAER